MRLENEDTLDVTVYAFKSAKTSIKEAEVLKIVDGFWDEFKALAGTTKGRVLSIVEKDDDHWPTIEEYRKMDLKEKHIFHPRFKGRCIRLLNCIKGRMEGNFRYRYFPAVNYIGSGRIVVWWRFKKPKKKELDGAIGSK